MQIFEMIAYVLLVMLIIHFQRKKREWKKKIVFEYHFEEFLSNVSAAYGLYQNLEDALWGNMSRVDYEWQEENTYVLVFQAMTEVVKSEGDVIEDGVSVFQRNIQYLKEELREHLILEEDRKYLFLGLDVISFLPIFFLPLVALWAVHTSDNMTAFYFGSYGFVMKLTLFIVTFAVYIGILWLMLPEIPIKNTYLLEKMLLKNLVIGKTIDRYINKNYTSCLKKNEVLKKIQGYGNIREFLLKKVLYTMIGAFASFLLLCNFHMYKNMWHWQEIGLVMVTMLGMFFLPEVKLAFEYWKSRDKRMEECLRMQTIVLLLIHFEQITLEEILQWMERFADMFYPQLAKAVDGFSYRRVGVIEELKEEINDEGMRRVCESLLFCDELPVEQAFLDLEGERTYYLKKYFEERRKNQREYAAIGRVIAYLPLLVLIIVGMVIPFVAEGIGELQKYSNELMGFM